MDKLELLEKYYNNPNLSKSLESMSEAELDTYRSVITEMAEEKHPMAMELLAYDYYGGSPAFPCDWVKSRDLLLELRVHNPAKTGQWANTLGYIYYYGRCTGGIPDYEEAFRFFSLGAAYGYYESQYKLADMYLGGKYVENDERAAFCLVCRYYDENYEAFLAGNKKQNLADISLRLGNMFLKGTGVSEDPVTAYRYFLVAETAILERMELSYFFGNQKVLDRIREGKLECLKRISVDTRSKTFTSEVPLGIDSALEDNYVIRVKTKRLKDSLRLDSVRMNRGVEAKRKIEVSALKYGYLEFKESVADYARFPEKIEIMGGKDEFFADSISVLPLEGGLRSISFFHCGSKTAEIVCRDFGYKMR
ncbi:MAG: sel1 repeat family protein [Oscillospiraceae bacterium]|nr:sel1 repeat family protein [Oscillospiraceae bacterium]